MKQFPHYLLLICSMICLYGCTIAFPVIASKHSTPNYYDIYDINKIRNHEVIKIITKDYDLIIGEVINKKIYDTQEDFDINQIISEENKHFFPNIGDTLNIEISGITHRGIFQYFDFYNIYIKNEMDKVEAIKIKKIDYMTCKGREFSILTINQIIKKSIPYMLTIKETNKDIYISSDDILKIQKMKFEPVIPFAFLAGGTVDSILLFVWILISIGIF